MTRIMKMINVALLLSMSQVMGQSLTLPKAEEIALQNNPSIQAANLNIELARQQKRSAAEFGKFAVTWTTGEYNSVNRDNNYTFTQTVPFPAALSSQLGVAKAEMIRAEKEKAVTAIELVYQVREAYYHLAFLQASQKILRQQDSLFAGFAEAAAIRFRTGESTLLEKANAESQSLEIKNQLRQNDFDIQMAETELQRLLKSQDPPQIASEFTERTLPNGLDTTSLRANPQLSYLQQQIEIQHRAKRAEVAKMLPDILIGYFNQSLVGYQNIGGQDQYFDASKRFQGFQLGLAFPLWFAPAVAKIKSASINQEIARTQKKQYDNNLKSNFKQTLQALDKGMITLNYYKSTALPNAKLILDQAEKSYRAGEIGYMEYMQSIRNAIGIKLGNLQALYDYNRTIIKLEFLLGQ